MANHKLSLQQMKPASTEGNENRIFRVTTYNIQMKLEINNKKILKD